MYTRAASVWLLLLLTAVLNGAFRTAVLSPRLGEPTGHVVSTALLSSLIVGLAVSAIPYVAPPSAAAAWRIGALWTAMTIAFEFLGGHYLFGAPWSKLLADYNIAAGRIWILVLAATLCAPPAAFRIRHARQRKPYQACAAR